jgi:hypothetical protein
MTKAESLLLTIIERGGISSGMWSELRRWKEHWTITERIKSLIESGMCQRCGINRFETENCLAMCAICRKELYGEKEA